MYYMQILSCGFEAGNDRMLVPEDEDNGNDGEVEIGLGL